MVDAFPEDGAAVVYRYRCGASGERAKASSFAARPPASSINVAPHAPHPEEPAQRVSRRARSVGAD